MGGQSESQGLPGHHGPGVATADVDGDDRTEVVFLTKDSVLHIVEGATGKEQATAKPRVAPGAARWELAWKHPLTSQPWAPRRIGSPSPIGSPWD